MKRLLILALVLFAFPATAGEKSALQKQLDSMPPMDARDRAAFDKAARSVYREECNCLSFLFEGKQYGIKFPLTDSDRQLVINGLRHGLLIPLSPSGLKS